VRGAAAAALLRCASRARATHDRPPPPHLGSNDPRRSRFRPCACTTHTLATHVAAGDALMRRLAEKVLEAGVMVAPARYSAVAPRRGPPSLKIYVSAAFTPADLKAIAAALGAAARAVL